MTHEVPVTNVQFLPLQPLVIFNRILDMGDLHLVIQKSQASDLVMPSKLTTILAVGGLALVTANKGSELHQLVHAHEIGLVIDADCQASLNEGIRKAIAGEWRAITSKARLYAEKHLSIDSILHSYEKNVMNGNLRASAENAVKSKNSKMMMKFEPEEDLDDFRSLNN